MRMLIIDDMKERHEGLTRQHNVKYDTIDSAYSYDEAIKLLGEHTYDYISFDHDLGWEPSGEHKCDALAEHASEPKSGADIARWMANEGITCKAACVHSQNSQGALNILSILKSGEVSETVPDYRPFTWGRVWYESEE